MGVQLERKIESKEEWNERGIDCEEESCREKWMNKVFCCRAANARAQLFSEFKLSVCLQQDTLAAEQGASCY